MAKELWTRLPRMRDALQLLGPEFFSAQELRGRSRVEEDQDDPLVGPYASESGYGLEDLDVYDIGPVVDDDGDVGGAPSGGSGPASSSALPAAGRNLRSTYLMKYLRNYTRDASPVLQPNGPRWVDHASFW